MKIVTREDNLRQVFAAASILPTFILLILAAVLVVPASALPGKPSFAPGLYADGELWGTKRAAILPAPNDNNVESFDKLFIIINSNNGMQLPVAEAAPRNFDYNGGRWFTHTVEWTQAAFDDYGTVPLLTSYEDIMMQADMGYLTITAGSPDPTMVPDYFECPLLPVK